jgi:hypothetical protein
MVPSRKSGGGAEYGRLLGGQSQRMVSIHQRGAAAEDAICLWLICCCKAASIASCRIPEAGVIACVRPVWTRNGRMRRGIVLFLFPPAYARVNALLQAAVNRRTGVNGVAFVRREPCVLDSKKCVSTLNAVGVCTNPCIAAIRDRMGTEKPERESTDSAPPREREGLQKIGSKVTRRREKKTCEK